MVPKPQPKAELIISGCSPQEWDGILFITTASQDAREWVLNQAPAYGDLKRTTPHTYILFVFDIYDLDQVRQYLLSMGD
jgi:hypothetical protein